MYALQGQQPIRYAVALGADVGDRIGIRSWGNTGVIHINGSEQFNA